MTAIRWMLFRCPECRTTTIVLRRWGFDHEGTLVMEGWCKDCGNNLIITHDFDEQRADVREAYHAWCEKVSGEPTDLKLWEWEVKPDGEDSA